MPKLTNVGQVWIEHAASLGLDVPAVVEQAL